MTGDHPPAAFGLAIAAIRRALPSTALLLLLPGGAVTVGTGLPFAFTARRSAGRTGCRRFILPVGAG